MCDVTLLAGLLPPFPSQATDAYSAAAIQQRHGSSDATVCRCPIKGQNPMRIAGLILAGGTNRRMGGTEKAFLSLGGITMLDRVARCIEPQCDSILVSANGDPARFAAHGFAMFPDTQSRGPMAALAGAMDWFALEDSRVTHILSVPGDTPFLPSDLVARFRAALKPDSLAVCAASGGRLHPVVGLWPLEARKELSDALAGGTLGFRDALQGHKVERVEWMSEPRDPFFNVNTPQDLARAEAMVSI